MSEWQPIETFDFRPDQVLIYNAESDSAVVADWEPYPKIPPWRWMTLDGPTYHRDFASHWTPLPPPPAHEPE